MSPSGPFKVARRLISVMAVIDGKGKLDRRGFHVDSPQSDATLMSMLSTEHSAHRRQFLSGATMALSASLLPGCVAISQFKDARRAVACLPTAIVSRNRLIRELVGLRPYRESGFVVRREQLGAKSLVHNYGHGGAGITLSWGSSRLATELGLAGHQGSVAVLGAGIMGLTTARLVQEAGFSVTVYAAALPPETTSNIAGAGWYPSSLFRRDAVSDAFRVQLEAAAHYSYRRFQIMVGPEYGVRWMRQYELYSTPAPATTSDPSFTTLMHPMLPEVQELRPGEHPFGANYVRQYTGMVVEPPRLLRQLLRDHYTAGGKVEVRNFKSPAQLTSLNENLIFNCTGLGSRTLFLDQALRPMRGQLAVLLPQEEVNYSISHEDGLYMFPRSDGVILGGTHELDDWNLQPDPATTTRLLEDHKRIFSSIACSGPQR